MNPKNTIKQNYNDIEIIEDEYIRADRSIHSVRIKNKQNEKILVYYNDQGQYFKVYNSIEDCKASLYTNVDLEIIEFCSEDDLDEYLYNYDLNAESAS